MSLVRYGLAGFAFWALSFFYIPQLPMTVHPYLANVTGGTHIFIKPGPADIAEDVTPEVLAAYFARVETLMAFPETTENNSIVHTRHEGRRIQQLRIFDLGMVVITHYPQVNIAYASGHFYGCLENNPHERRCRFESGPFREINAGMHAIANASTDLSLFFYPRQRLNGFSTPAFWLLEGTNGIVLDGVLRWTGRLDLAADRDSNKCHLAAPEGLNGASSPFRPRGRGGVTRGGAAYMGAVVV